MDNEFQWRHRMRELNQAVEPARDLWPDIAARLAPRRPRWHAAFALAASLLLAIGAGLTATQGNRPAAPHGNGLATALPAAANETADADIAVAARQLDQASADLQAALEARPDAIFLVGMLNRTHAQRMRLMRQPAISG